MASEDLQAGDVLTVLAVVVFLGIVALLRVGSLAPAEEPIPRVNEAGQPLQPASPAAPAR
jgi:hypothetical protein